MTFVRVMGSLEWNYPWELSSSLYRIGDVRAMLESIVEHHGAEGISHPNKLEECGELVTHSNQCEAFIKPMCACSKGPVASAVVINRVQELFQNPVYQETQMDVEELDQMFWEGRRYKVEHYTGSKFNAMHIGDFVLMEGTENSPLEEATVV